MAKSIFMTIVAACACIILAAIYGCASFPLPKSENDSILYIPVRTEVEQGKVLYLNYFFKIKNSDHTVPLNTFTGKTYALVTDLPAGEYEFDRLSMDAAWGGHWWDVRLSLPFELKPGAITVFPYVFSVSVTDAQNHAFIPLSQLSPDELSALTAKIDGFANREKWQLYFIEPPVFSESIIKNGDSQTHLTAPTPAGTVLFLPLNIEILPGRKPFMLYRLHVKDSKKEIVIRPLKGKTYDVFTDLPAGKYEIDVIGIYYNDMNHWRNASCSIKFELKPGTITVFPRVFGVRVAEGQGYSMNTLSGLSAEEMEAIFSRIDSLRNNEAWVIDFDKMEQFKPLPGL